MSYDKKFRQRALSYWAAGHSKKETAAVFGVSPATLQTWKSRLKESGTLAPKKRRETWRKIEPCKLVAIVKQHPDAYLQEIADAFGCSEAAIRQALKRMKISRKKNHSLPGGGRKFSAKLS
jgi:transposase